MRPEDRIWIGRSMYASVLAGGSGTRLWPLSTQATPKEFLQLPGLRTMLQDTVNRIAPLVPLDNLYVVTSRDYVEPVGAQLLELARENIVAEPSGRGTAASIGLAAALIVARDAEAVIGSFPADHRIQEVPGVQEAPRLGGEVGPD